MSIYFSGLMAPLDKNNVDTDQIIPKQFLTSTSRDGFDAALFYDWRYLDNDEPNPEFILNRPCYQGAQILLTRDNFGCYDDELAFTAYDWFKIGAGKIEF